VCGVCFVLCVWEYVVSFVFVQCVLFLWYVCVWFVCVSVCCGSVVHVCVGVCSVCECVCVVW